MHVAFPRVVSEDSVDNNADFAIGEPALGTEPSLGSHSRRGHEEYRRDADGQSDEAFDEEKPARRLATLEDAMKGPGFHTISTLPCHAVPACEAGRMP